MLGYINLITIILSTFFILLLATISINLQWLLEKITNSEAIQQINSANQWQAYYVTAQILLISPLNFMFQNLWGVMLNIKERLAVFSVAGVLANIGAIIGLLFASPDNFISVPIGMVCGVFLSNLLYFYFIKKDGYYFTLAEIINFKNNFNTYRAEIIQTFKLFLPRIFLVDGFVVAGVALIQLANQNGQNTAFDIVTSIQGAFLVLSTSFSIVFFPKIAKLINDKYQTKTQMFGQLYKMVKLSAVSGLIVTVFAIVLAPVVMWVFESFGKGQNNAAYIIFLTQISSARLFFQSIKEMLDKYFYSIESITVPIILSLSASFAQVISILVLSKFKVDAGVNVSLSLIIYFAVAALVSLSIFLNQRRKAYVQDIKHT